MTIILFFLTLTLFTLTCCVLLSYAFRHPSFHTHLRIMINGIRNGLNTSGLSMEKPSTRVTVYKWIPMENGCNEAFDRADMPAKDIIDWMEIGLPRTPEMRRQCSKNCKCRLMAVTRSVKK